MSRFVRTDASRATDRAVTGWWRGTALMTALAAACLTGCGREEVRVYQAPKDQAAAPVVTDPHAGLDMTSGMAAAGLDRPSSASGLKWQTPAGWKEQPSGQMRVGFFTVAGEHNQQAEVTIIPLSGRAGSDLDNVNRWLAQIGSPPVTSEQLAALGQPVPVAASPGQLYDLSGPESSNPRKRTLAAVARRDGTAWFFKMTGDDALVAAQKAAYIGFLETARFEDAAVVAPAAASTGSAPGAPASAAPAAATTPLPASPDRPAFAIPANWKEQSPGSMQLAKYVPVGAEEKAEITVAVLPGDGGGTVGNVNRWRRQLGLAPWSDAEVQQALRKLNVTGGESYLVDLANPATQKRMLAAGVVRGSRSWFYKLMGETQVVEAEAAAFTRFVEGVTYAP